MRAWPASVLALLATACGPADSVPGPGTEGSSGGVDSSGATTSIPSDDSTGAPACDPSEPDIAEAVTVNVRNAGTEPVYLAETKGCVVGAVFSLTRPDAGEPIEWIVDDCQTCAAVIDGACGCPAACPVDSAIRLDPGGVYATQWTGAIAFDVELPPECTNADCGSQCTALAKAEPGPYVARAAASTTIDCGGAECECIGEPAPAGWCRVNGTIAGGEGIIAERELEYPAAIPVELVLGGA